MELGELDGIALEVTREELERDRLTEPQIIGAVDLAHAAFAQPADDAIAIGHDGSWLEPPVVD
jgi:hypothetical protein